MQRRSAALTSADARSYAAPAHVGDEWNWAIARFVGADRRRLIARTIRVVHEHRTTAHVIPRHHAPVAAVLGAVAVVAHHEEVALWYDERAPVVVRRLCRCRAEARARERVALLP